MSTFHSTRGNPTTSFNIMTPLQHKYCVKITEKISAIPIASPFLEPVNTADVPGYLKVIKKPCDLGTVMSKLKKNEYTNVDEWKNDMNLIWKNATTFNKEGCINQMASELARVFKEYVTEIPRNENDEWIIKVRRAHAKYMKLIQSGQHRKD